MAESAAEDDLEEHARAFTECLWARLGGWACLAVGVSPFWEDGRYRHTGFLEVFRRWPQEAEALLSAGLGAASRHDVWVCPLLRSRRQRRRGTAIAGRHLWVDIDHECSSDEAALVDELTGRDGSFAVASGSPGHLHVYVQVAEPMDVGEIEVGNRRLSRTLRGDAKWDETSLLRLPGTINHKPTATLGAPAPVRVLTW